MQRLLGQKRQNGIGASGPFLSHTQQPDRRPLHLAVGR